PEFITIGKILAPWGTRGKLKVEVATDFPQRFTPQAKVYINRQPMTITSTDWHQARAIIELNGIDSLKEAEKLRGQLVEIHHSQAYLLPEGQYYHFQLVGLEVRTTQGELLGNITEILHGPGNDNFVVSGSQGEILIPAIEDVVKTIELNQGYLVIEPIEGLLSLNKKTTG
ncbi:unnamed protein product, partial [marine sediment metagenome]